MIEPRRDKIQRLVLEYVKLNPKSTKTKVIKELEEDGEGSLKTVHSVIIELVGSGKLKVLKDRPNSQTHYLIINDKNDYNLIDNFLSELEDSIDLMSEPMNNIRQLRFHEMYLGGSQKTTDLREHFEFPYRYSFSTIFLGLLIYINTKIQAKDDLQILYTRIFELMISLNQQVFDMDEIEHVLNPFINKLRELQQSPTLKLHAKAHRINIKLANNLIAKIESFKKRLLPEIKV